MAKLANDGGKIRLMQSARLQSRSERNTFKQHKAEASAKRILAVRPCEIKLLLPCKSMLRVVAVFDMLLAFACVACGGRLAAVMLAGPGEGSYRALNAC